jgi:hypothetical protein
MTHRAEAEKLADAWERDGYGDKGLRLRAERTADVLRALLSALRTVEAETAQRVRRETLLEAADEWKGNYILDSLTDSG